MNESLLTCTVGALLREVHMDSCSGDVDEYFPLFRVVWEEKFVDDDQISFHIDFEVIPYLLKLHWQRGRIRSDAGTEDEDVGLANTRPNVFEG